MKVGHDDIEILPDAKMYLLMIHPPALVSVHCK